MNKYSLWSKVNTLVYVPLLLLLLSRGVVAGPGEVWYGLYQGDNKIGWHHEQVVADGALWKQTSHTELNLAMGGMTFRTNIDGHITYADDYRPRGFGYRVQGDMINLAVTGWAAGDTLNVKIVSGDNTQEMQFGLDQMTLPQLADLALRGRELTVGDSFSFRCFEPTALKDGELTIRVDRETRLLVGSVEQRVLVLQMNFAGIATETWLDSEGVPLLITAPMGLVFRRETPELATAATTGEPLDLLTQAAITPTRPIANPRELFAARYRLSGAPLDGLALTGAGQAIVHTMETGEGLTIYIERPAGVPAVPARGEVQPPDAFCDYDQKDVKKLAQQLPGLRNTILLPRDYVRADLRWIHENITPRLTMSLPRASQVLAMRHGDCNEMAVLLCALLRAQQIPAQVVAGVVYVDGKFYYHAWVEAQIGDWVAIDPAFNQESADATHIKLVAGDLLAQTRILNVIGRLRIEPLPVLRQ